MDVWTHPRLALRLHKSRPGIQQSVAILAQGVWLKKYILGVRSGRSVLPAPSISFLIAEPFAIAAALFALAA